jgi:uncharacterized delta-60 repeat protein
MVTFRTLSFAVLMVAATAHAQQGTLDTSFDPGVSTAGVSSDVLAIAVQDDGRIIIAGGFFFYQGQPRRGIARLHPDGTLDMSFDPGSGVEGNAHTVHDVLLDMDGRIMIVGNFCLYNGTIRNNVARLNVDGSLDTTFDPGMGPVGQVNAIAHHDANKYLIGGAFDNYMGTDMEGIVRLNDDGSMDPSFNTGGAGAGETVWCIATFADDRIFIGGQFLDYNGTPATRIARLLPDGTFDTSFDVGSGADNTVWTAAIQGDGKAIIGGAFDTVDGAATGRAARLLADGTVDTDLMAGTGANGNVYTCYVQPDGAILLGGEFSAYNGTPRLNLVRLDGNGAVDATFLPDPGPDNDVRAIALQQDGQIMVGGILLEYDEVPRRHVARVNGTGAIGIRELEAMLLSVSPNPATDRLTVRMAEVHHGAILEVCDAAGEQVLAQAMHGTTTVLDVHALAPGTYVIKTAGALPVRFVKQ